MIYKPTSSADCWKEFLADPEKQWKKGYSARSMAHAWETYNGLPKRIKKALSPISENIEPLIVIPEFKVPMPGQGADSQNDAFLLARIGDQTAAIMIEGKVNESFGPEVGSWMKNASMNKHHRLDGICDILGLTDKPDPKLRYQLFHRTASAVLTARRFNADFAIMLVHSFSQDHIWFEDYIAFARTMGVSDPLRGTVQQTNTSTAKPLYLGWVTGEPRFLSA